MLYADRRDAGRQLADELAKYKAPDTVVLALPRGGVVLGREVSRRLHAPLGLVLVKKVSSPFHSEYAVGAVAEDDVVVYDQKEAAMFGESWLKNAEAKAKGAVAERRALYFENGVSRPELRGKTVVIVDDGIATGLTAEAAVRSVRKHRPKKVVVAAPVASRESMTRLSELADEVVILDNPDNFLGAVGTYYRQFGQVSEDEVVEILREADHVVSR